MSFPHPACLVTYEAKGTAAGCHQLAVAKRQALVDGCCSFLWYSGTVTVTQMFIMKLFYSQHICNTEHLPVTNTSGQTAYSRTKYYVATPLVSIQFKHTNYALCGLGQCVLNSLEFYINVCLCSCSINVHTGVQTNPQCETAFLM